MLKKFALSASVMLCSLGALEWHQRSGSPKRWQRVTQYKLIGQTPVWTATGPEAPGVRNDPCADDAGADIVLLGDSIFYGVQLEPEDTLGPSLSRALKRTNGDDACVVNLSIPGLTLEQELAVIHHEWEQLKPSIVVLEIWHNSPHRVTQVGNAAFNFGRLDVDDDGIPNPFGIPSAVNRVLFANSVIWQRSIEGFASQTAMSSQLWQEALPDIQEFHAWLQDQDVQLVLAFATKLGTPWSAGRDIERGSYSTVGDWAKINQIPTLWFEDILSGHPVEDIRLDSCCHLNKAGTALVSSSLATVIQPMLIDSSKEPHPDHP